MASLLQGSPYPKPLAHLISDLPCWMHSSNKPNSPLKQSPNFCLWLQESLPTLAVRSPATAEVLVLTSLSPRPTEPPAPPHLPPVCVTSASNTMPPSLPAWYNPACPSISSQKPLLLKFSFIPEVPSSQLGWLWMPTTPTLKCLTKCGCVSACDNWRGKHTLASGG